MDLAQLSLTVSAGALVGAIGLLIKVSMRLGALEVKVETMWAFQMRRATSETVASGLGQFNSPLSFTDEARAALEPLHEELLDFWHGLPKSVRASDADALLAIEARFGDQLLKSVCMPCGLSHGAFLLLALTIAKGSNQVTLATSEPARGNFLLRVARWFR